VVLDNFPKTTKIEKLGDLHMESERNNKKEYSSDQPIVSIDQDSFNRWPFSERIADTIARRSDPGSLVIAIYGIWGDAEPRWKTVGSGLAMRHATGSRKDN
jgi:hypothetical protein